MGLKMLPQAKFEKLPRTADFANQIETQLGRGERDDQGRQDTGRLESP